MNNFNKRVHWERHHEDANLYACGVEEALAFTHNDDSETLLTFHEEEDSIVVRLGADGDLEESEILAHFFSSASESDEGEELLPRALAWFESQE